MFLIITGQPSMMARVLPFIIIPAADDEREKIPTEKGIVILLQIQILKFRMMPVITALVRSNKILFLLR